MPVTTLAPARPVISVVRGAFGYDGQEVVFAADLEVYEGEVIAVLGPNGAGKTTLAKGLLGLSEHLRGTAAVFGTPLQDSKARSRMGYVPQRHTLSASVRATVREIVDVGRLPHRNWWQPQRANDHGIVTRALETVSLKDRSANEVSTLSGGQQRRVLIARALAAEPDVLIMDEPMAGIDRFSQSALVKVFSHLASRGVTMIIVTHEFAALRGVVTRVIEIDQGRIAFDGTSEAYGLAWAGERGLAVERCKEDAGNGFWGSTTRSTAGAPLSSLEEGRDGAAGLDV